MSIPFLVGDMDDNTTLEGLCYEIVQNYYKAKNSPGKVYHHCVEFKKTRFFLHLMVQYSGSESMRYAWNLTKKKKLSPVEFKTLLGANKSSWQKDFPLTVCFKLAEYGVSGKIEEKVHATEILEGQIGRATEEDGTRFLLVIDENNFHQFGEPI